LEYITYIVTCTCIR